MTPWYEWAIEKLTTFLTLKAGWNSYHSLAISREAVETAQWLIGNLYDDTPKPLEFVPTAFGGVLFLWQTDSWECEVECLGSGRIQVSTRRVERFGKNFLAASVLVNTFMEREVVKA